MSYNLIVRMIDKIHGTALPALFIVIVEKCLKENVFVKDGMKNTIDNIEKRLNHKYKNFKDDDCILTCSKCQSRYFLPISNIHRRCGFNKCKGILHKLD